MHHNNNSNLAKLYQHNSISGYPIPGVPRLSDIRLAPMQQPLPSMSSLDVEPAGRGDESSEFPVLPLDGSASGLTRHALSKIDQSASRKLKYPKRHRPDDHPDFIHSERQRQPECPYRDQLSVQHPLDVDTFTEPADPIRLELLHRFLNPSVPRSDLQVAMLQQELRIAYPESPRLLAGPGNQAIRSSYPGLPFHVVRLEGIIGRKARKEILAAFRQFDRLKPFKHVPKTQKRTTLDSEHHFHPYHMAIVKRMGNELGASKDANQCPRSRISNPNSRQIQRQNAAYHLTDLLDELVATPIRRYYQKLDPTTTEYAFHLNHHANRAAEWNSSKPSSKRMRLGGLAGGVAFGYGEARHPHLDVNDSHGVPSLIVQLLGPPGITHFPQLNLDVRLAAGDAIIAPTSALLHHGTGVGSVDERRVTAVFYTCRHMENLVGNLVEGTYEGGAFEGLMEDDIEIL